MSTVSGYFAVDGGAWERVQTVLDGLVATGGAALSAEVFVRHGGAYGRAGGSGGAHGRAGGSGRGGAGEVVFAFGLASAELEAGFGGWLAAFEDLLARVGEAAGGPVSRALVVLDAPSRPHPVTVGGLHLYRWSRVDEPDAPTLRLQHDDVLVPDFASRFAPAHDDRLATFVERVVETGVVYGLRGEGWARAGEGDAQRIPFWCDAAAAARAARGEWSGYAPKAIELDDWVAQWLTGMVEDGIAASVSPRGPEDETCIDSGELVDRFAP